MNIADALSGGAGLEGIRWMLTGAPRRSLRRELSALLSDRSRLERCCLRRARFKPGRELVAYYDTHVRVEGAGRDDVRTVVVTWKLDADGDHTTAALAEMEAEAVRRGLTAPFRKLVADAPVLGMHVEVSPLDVYYPQLVRVCDPQYVRDMLARAHAAGDGEQNHSSASRYSVTLMRYRPGHRHVLRYDPLNAHERRAIFAKLYSGEDGMPAFRLAKKIGGWLAEHGKGVSSLQPLTYVAEDGVVLYPEVLGTQLSECLRCSGQHLSDALKAAGEALYALHQLPEGVAGRLKVDNFESKVKKIARNTEHVSALLPSAGAAIEALLEHAQELHERLSPEPPSFIQRDFKAEHVWLTPSGPLLIDFDSCRWGDPALDIGKFLAVLRFECAVYDQHERQHVQEQFLAGYGLGARAERIVRARLYEAIELIKLTLSHVRIFERDWACRTERLIGLAQSALDDLQLSLGLPAKRSCLLGFHSALPNSRATRGGRRRRASAWGRSD